MEKIMKIKGMHCDACEKLIKMAVEDSGAKVLSISHKSGEAIISAKDATAFEHALKAIVAEGYTIQ